MPKVGSLQYLWCTVAKKSASGALLQNWSAATRVTGDDGKNGADGAKGDTGPTVVYRGIYNESSIYYGTSKRVDSVKYNDTYYVACVITDNNAKNGFSGIAPTDTNFWNGFGAQFESVATHLLLAEKASIGNWYHDKGKIVSTLLDGNKITLDASIDNAMVLIESSNSGGDYSEHEKLGSKISLNASKGIIETRAATNTSSVSYMSPSGIFCNSAETDAVSATLGFTHKAAIVGLGFGTVHKDNWQNENFLAGVYGRAKNEGKAPAYGGFFQNLMAAGLFLKTKVIAETNSPVYITESDSLVIGYSRNQQLVYLPNDGVIGRTIFFKQWWSGHMRIYPKGGQTLWDDSSQNTYFDIGCGEFAILVFTIGYIDGVKKEGWLFSRFKY